jgi:peptidoglycan hydrolase FlgJ
MRVDSVSAAMQTPNRIDKSSELYKACEDFESILIKQMLDVMRKTVPKDALLDGGIGQDLYEDMLYGKYAEQMAKSSSLGLARMIYEQVSRSA